jgi:CBS domain-containing protein
MLQRNEIHHSDDAKFQNYLKERLGEVLPLLDRDEISRLLQTLRESLVREIAWVDGLDAERDALLKRIVLVTEPSTLSGIHDDLNAREMVRFIKTESVTALHESCGQYRDLLVKRALFLVEEGLERGGNGPPPVPFALISMGSDGRGEQTLITDQDHLVVYADGGGEEADAYFKLFSEGLVEKLAKIGFKKCTGGIMPTNPTWRGSYTQWRKKLLAIVRYEYADYANNLMDLIVLSDARYVAGDEDLAGSLINLIRGLEQDYFQVLWGMAKAATEMRLALSFLKRIWTEGSGEHKGEFNLKLLAWAPLVMNVRILAINQGIPATNTVQRIELLQEERSFSASTANGLNEAYAILTKHRILQQVKVIKGIQNDAHFLNPYNLPTEDREGIRQALLRIEELQKMIHTNFSIV